MRIHLLICTVFVLFICLFSAKTFAQGPPDPGGDPMLHLKIIGRAIVEIVPLQPSLIYADKNHNTAIGIDGDHSQMKIHFVPQPTADFLFKNYIVASMSKKIILLKDISEK
jgi:hypothetical protein